MDLSAQWRRFSATAEYIFVHAPSGNQQGAVVEPGVTLGARRLDVVARGEWERAAGANGWGAGAAITSTRAMRARACRSASSAHRPRRRCAAASYALARLTFTID